MDLCDVRILLMKTLGDRIRFFRNDRGWSLEELSRRAGMSKDALWKIETDQVRQPYTLARIAAALDVPISELRGNIPSFTRGSEVLKAAAKSRDQQQQEKIDRKQGKK